MSADYATLEEAFGIRSFLAPEPTVMRGDVGPIQEARHRRMGDDIQSAYDHSMGAPVQGPLQGAPLSESRRPRRGPVQFKRCPYIARAHARGGARAAWAAVPKCAKCDMMWYAVRELVATEFVTMMLVALCLYLLLK